MEQWLLHTSLMPPINAYHEFSFNFEKTGYFNKIWHNSLSRYKMLSRSIMAAQRSYFSYFFQDSYFFLYLEQTYIFLYFWKKLIFNCRISCFHRNLQQLSSSFWGPPGPQTPADMWLLMLMSNTQSRKANWIFILDICEAIKKLGLA